MVTALAYLRLIRFPILVLIALMQYSIRWFILEPMLSINGYELLISDRYFAFLVLSTVLIAAGGYAINDYFDVKVDRINKIKKVIVDRYIKRRVAMMLHLVLSGLGLVIASFLAWRLGMWQLSALYVFVVFTLWYYSTTLQHQFLTGNLAISLMAGFVPLIVGLFEIPLQNAAHPEMLAKLGYSIFNVPAFWILGYSISIFILTLGREIAKDVVDFRGDRIFGAKTIPIQIGVKATKSVLITVYAIFIAGFTWAYFQYLHVHIGMTTVFFFVALLIVTKIALIIKARTKKHFLYTVHVNNAITLILILSAYLIKLSIETYFS
ncbi:MAG: geranylgeranylglycerol-phosphate geranylgeranyltransferase [Cryomorphaceae bacterium]